MYIYTHIQQTSKDSVRFRGIKMRSESHPLKKPSVASDQFISTDIRVLTVIACKINQKKEKTGE